MATTKWPLIKIPIASNATINAPIALLKISAPRALLAPIETPPITANAIIMLLKTINKSAQNAMLNA